MNFDLFATLRAIRGRDDLSTVEAMVLVVLASRAGEDGRAWPSYGRIARDAKVALSTAKKCIKALASRGLVHVTTRTNDDGTITSNVYRLALGTVRTEDPPVRQTDHPVLATDGRSPAGGRSAVHVADGGGPADGPEVSQRSIPNRSTPEVPMLFASPDGQQARSGRRHTRPFDQPTAQGDHARVLAAYVESFRRAKSTTPTISAREGRIANQMIATYGADETIAIISRALEDTWQATNKPLLHEIAGVADKFRGTTPAKRNGVHVQTAPADGPSPWEQANHE